MEIVDLPVAELTAKEGHIYKLPFKPRDVDRWLTQMDSGYWLLVENNVVINGIPRFLAAKQAGRLTVPCKIST